MPRFSVPRGIEVKTWGNVRNRPMLLIHGAWFKGWRCWQWFGPKLARQGFFVVAMSRPGRGGSTSSGFGLKGQIEAVEQVTTAIHTACGQWPILIGHSHGGLIAQHVAHRGKGKYPATVLMASVGRRGLSPIGIRFARRYPWRVFITFLKLSPWELVRNKELARYWLFGENTADNDPWFNIIEDDSPIVFLQTLFPARLDLRNQPILVLHGKEDRLISRPRVSLRIVTRYACDYRIVPGTHCGMLRDQADAAIDAIVNWLRK